MSGSTHKSKRFLVAATRASLLHPLYNRDVPTQANEKLDHRRPHDASVMTTLRLSQLKYLE